jgi:hypothetical protein
MDLRYGTPDTIKRVVCFAERNDYRDLRRTIDGGTKSDSARARTFFFNVTFAQLRTRPPKHLNSRTIMLRPRQSSEFDVIDAALRHFGEPGFPEVPMPKLALQAHASCGTHQPI